LLDQALHLNPEDSTRLGGTWFLLYLYTMLADAQLDDGRALSAKDVMTSAALLDAGTRDLRRAVAGTQYEHLVDRTIQIAIAGQLSDHPSEARGRSTETAQQDALDKNAYLVSLASAYAAQDKSGAEIVRFVSNLSLAVQYLDDVTDRCKDFQSGNFTFLLLSATTPPRQAVQLGADGLLYHLVSSGSLEETLSRTIQALDEASESVRSFPHGPFKHRLDAYLRALVVDIEAIRKLAERQRRAVEQSGVYTRTWSDELGRALTRIAFSS
jgi:hypothetical protein